ncbi:carboxylesterase family protein [Mycobacterium ulcerans str. Harvey]|uniref:Carboxylesterase family protein n=1 Tax=Mycobacterium ulcerans str. Harvey TaxID=1299332 RepID=A0ABN0QYX3_MYCUL|nr:carboxylesterase family protein [Mycobacterium ulcerans str. Harvey]
MGSLTARLSSAATPCSPGQIPADERRLPDPQRRRTRSPHASTAAGHGLHPRWGLHPGSSATPIYDGAALARRGCVYVSVNYRLGALGCLDLSSLSTPDIAIDGNLYLRDLVMALQWIQDNIAEFGGDRTTSPSSGKRGAHITATLLAFRRPKSFRPRDLGESGRRYGASAGNRGRIRDTLCRLLGRASTTPPAR